MAEVSKKPEPISYESCPFPPYSLPQSNHIEEGDSIKEEKIRRRRRRKKISWSEPSPRRKFIVDSYGVKRDPVTLLEITSDAPTGSLSVKDFIEGR